MIIKLDCQVQESKIVDIRRAMRRILINHRSTYIQVTLQVFILKTIGIDE